MSRLVIVSLCLSFSLPPSYFCLAGLCLITENTINLTVLVVPQSKVNQRTLTPLFKFCILLATN